MEYSRNITGDMLKMMRTVEVLIAIIIITGAFIGVSYFAVLPSPHQVSPINLDAALTYDAGDVGFKSCFKPSRF